jgi:hypothetical protein
VNNPLNHLSNNNGAAFNLGPFGNLSNLPPPSNPPNVPNLTEPNTPNKSQPNQQRNGIQLFPPLQNLGNMANNPMLLAPLLNSAQLSPSLNAENDTNHLSIVNKDNLLNANKSISTSPAFEASPPSLFMPNLNFAQQRFNQVGGLSDVPSPNFSQLRFPPLNNQFYPQSSQQQQPGGLNKTISPSMLGMNMNMNNFVPSPGLQQMPPFNLINNQQFNNLNLNQQQPQHQHNPVMMQNNANPMLNNQMFANMPGASNADK